MSYEEVTLEFNINRLLHLANVEMMAVNNPKGIVVTSRSKENSDIVYCRTLAENLADAINVCFKFTIEKKIQELNDLYRSDEHD